MMSAILIPIDVIDHIDFLLLLYTVQTCSGLLASFFTWRGIAETKSLRLVATRPDVRYRIDVCGRHWSGDAGMRCEGMVWYGMIWYDMVLNSNGNGVIYSTGV